MVQPLWRTVWRFLKKLKIELSYDPASPLLDIYPEKVLVAQWFPTLCDPVNCSPLGFSVHEILQARILEWVAISFSSFFLLVHKGKVESRGKGLKVQW